LDPETRIGPAVREAARQVSTPFKAGKVFGRLKDESGERLVDRVSTPFKAGKVFGQSAEESEE